MCNKDEANNKYTYLFGKIMILILILTISVIHIYFRNKSYYNSAFVINFS